VLDLAYHHGSWEARTGIPEGEHSPDEQKFKDTNNLFRGSKHEKQKITRKHSFLLLFF
jgi:hypothetical protein